MKDIFKGKRKKKKIFISFYFFMVEVIVIVGLFILYMMYINFKRLYLIENLY